MEPLIRLIVRHQGGAQQGQADLAVRHADAVFAVIQHRRADGPVTHRGVAVVANLVLVPVMLPGTVGGAAEEAELDLLQRLPGVNRHGEGHLQQLMALVPVKLSDKIQPFGIVAKEDFLR